MMRVGNAWMNAETIFAGSRATDPLRRRRALLFPTHELSPLCLLFLTRAFFFPDVVTPAEKRTTQPHLMTSLCLFSRTPLLTRLAVRRGSQGSHPQTSGGPRARHDR